MRKLINWKSVLLVIFVFAASMSIMPGYVTVAMAEEAAAQQDVDKAGAVVAGSEGGAATAAGLSAGTVAAIVAGSAAVLAGVLIAAGNDSNGETGGTPTHHTPTSHH